MDPITTAILAALPALATTVISDAYEGLKSAIRRKWGDNAPIVEAISALEEHPGSKAQTADLQEKVTSVKATEDAEVAQALQRLVEQMKRKGIGGEAVAGIQFTMTGGIVQGVAGAGSVNIGSMTFGTPPKEG